MDSERLRSGREVLGDRTYLRVCRSVFAFRLVTTAMTSVFTPTSSLWSDALLALVAVISAWAMVSDAFVRRYFRHPSVAGVDVLLVTLLAASEWPDTMAMLVLALTMLTVGLVLSPWLGLPALILSNGVAIGYATDTSAAQAESQLATAATYAMPIALVGMTALGWTVRYAFVELERTRAQAMATERARLELEERNRLARQMHDSLGKTVNGISLAAQALVGAATAGRADDTRLLGTEIAKAADVAADESRALLRGLRRHLDDRPIAERMGELARSRATEGFSVRTQVTGVADLPPPIANEVLNITEEALENVTRHAQAQEARISLRLTPTGLELSIEDDGVGFDPASVSARERAGHFGIRGMHERAATTGGTCRVDGRPGAGTTVRCHWPPEVLKEEGEGT